VAKARQARIDRRPLPSAPVIEMIARLRLEGGTLRGIADRLNALAIKTATGGRWHPTTVRSAARLIEVRVT
jgi:Recombinase